MPIAVENVWKPVAAPARVSVPVPDVTLVSLTLSLTTKAMTYPYAKVTERLPELILNISAASTVLLASSGVWYKRFPDVKAS